MKLGVMIFFFILCFAISFDMSKFSVHLGNLKHYFDLASLIIVLVPTIVFAIGLYSWETYVKTFFIPFGNLENYVQSELIVVNRAIGDTKKFLKNLDGTETFKTVDYAKLTVLLIDSVKEQQEQIDKLKKEVKELKNGSS